MNNKWFKVFKIGKHTDKNGNVKEYTQEDLDTMVKVYNDQPENEKNIAKIVIGHDYSEKAPCFGIVEKLKTAKGFLYASFADVVTEFAEAVNKGLYRDVSIAHDSKLMLKHIAALGAPLPAIKGLDKLSFSDYDLNDLVMFSETETLDEETAYASDRASFNIWLDKDWETKKPVLRVNYDSTMTDNDKNSTTESVSKNIDLSLPSEEITKELTTNFNNWVKNKVEFSEKIINITNAFEFAQKKENNGNNELQGDEMKLREFAELARNKFDAETATKVTELAEQCFGKGDEKTYSEAEYNALVTELNTFKTKAKEAEFSEFCEKHKTKITPATKAILRTMWDNTEGKFEFSEGDTTTTLDNKAMLEKFVNGLPDVVDLSTNEYSETRQNPSVNRDEQLDKIADEYNKSRGI